MPEMSDKCAHALCHCRAQMEGEYCSLYCKMAEDNLETGCQCGHPECCLLHSPAVLTQEVCVWG